jgi:shikimate dehydrogenase
MFLQKGEARGAIVMNGSDMLVLQAEAAWEIWNR